MKAWFADGLLGRIFKNAGMLLTGRAASGVFGLVSLGLMARGLGVDNFGIVVLVQTYALMIGGLTTFQSWQVLIKHGADCLVRDDNAGIQGLLRFTTMLDVAGVILATTVAYFAAPLVGPALDWNAEVVRLAQPYSLSILFTVVATPTGVLRLFNRFDLLSAQSIVAPLTRMIGVIIAFLLEASPAGYLVAWFIGGALGGVSLIWLGWREAIRSGRLKGISWRVSFAPPRAGLWKFAIASNLNSSLLLVPNQMATFLVGLVAGPAAAGLYKIARDVSTALTKPAELLNQSIYPEFAKLGSRDDWHLFARLILRGGAIAAAAGLFLLMVTVVAGHPFITLVFGKEFFDAYTLMVMLVAAAAVTITGFSMDPALYAMGRPGLSLRVNAVAVLGVFLPLLIYLGRTRGAEGAGIAAMCSSVVTFVAMAVFTVAQLRLRAKPVSVS
jgi:O-antigen/teichoic acid export membrane protein